MIITLALAGVSIFSTYMVVKYHGVSAALAQVKLDVSAAKAEGQKLVAEAKAEEQVIAAKVKALFAKL